MMFWAKACKLLSKTKQTINWVKNSFMFRDYN
jgi:hypothetical protein